ncbi:MAG: ATP-binding protein [Candidatus Omnitrophica bacterium]|nr:ATP-binding protein [Candidatus Omnitrophota bacterium]
MLVKIRSEIGNEKHLLKGESARLVELLGEHGVDENTIFDIRISFEEVLRNAMLHGNKESKHKKVKIETEITDECVTISVEDEGEGFDIRKIPDPTCEENLLKEGGRGVFLVQNLMDEVEYLNGGRKVVMKKAF